MLQVFRRTQLCSFSFSPTGFSKRLKHKKREEKVRLYTEAALRHYDFHIGQKMDKLWPSVRVALLSQSKYCAVLNRFCDNYEKTAKNLAETGGFNFLANFKERKDCTGKYSIMQNKSDDIEEENQEKDDNNSSGPQVKETTLTSSTADLHFYTPPTRVLSQLEELEQKEAEIYRARGEGERPDAEFYVEKKLEKEKEAPFNVPSLLKAVIHSKGDATRFKPAKVDPASGKLSYYLMDAGSVLPVLALDLEPGCSVLDLCAAPGGKTHTILQTMLPGSLVCLDNSYGRVLRLKEVIRNYFPHSYLEDDKVIVLHRNGADYGHNNPDQFDRVLVDVPCFADRHTLTELDNNLFSPSRQGDRMMIQNTQQSLLLSALKACRPGGIVVYSTCTLLPPQNDGVIRSTLEYVSTQTSMEVSVVDTGPIAEAYEKHFVFNTNPMFSNLGQLVLPNVVANFGPTYFCKLRRVK